MKHFAVMVGIMFFALVAFASETATSQTGWQTYHNETFGYSVRYPADLFGPPEETEEADGVMMTSHDGHARLAFFGGPNDAGHTPASMADTLADFEEVREVTYRRVRGNWLVLSGYLAQTEDGEQMIFYWRVSFNADRSAVTGFRLEYPESQRDPYDGVIGRIGRSLTTPPLG